MQIRSAGLALFFLVAAVGCRQSGATVTAEPSQTADIQGLVFFASDAGGIADAPLAEQPVLFMPRQAADVLLGDAAELRFAAQEIALDQEALLTVLTQEDGSFRVAIPPGETVLCLADEFSEGVATTRGCGMFTARPGPNRVAISVGYGEILLESG